MAGEVIDLRGSPTGLEGLGQGLAQLIGAVTRDPEDELRQSLLENIPLSKELARSGHRFARGVQTGEVPVDPRLGDAGVPTEELALPPVPGLGLIPPGIMAELMTMFPEEREERVAAATEGILTPGETDIALYTRLLKATGR